jgi:allantoinase
MKNILYDYSAIIERKPFKLPNNARVGVWVILTIEDFDIGLPIPTPEGTSSTVPNLPVYTSRDYGNRVGIWRIIEVLEKHNIRATVVINANICEHYPIIVKECNKHGWEFVCHANTNSQFLGPLNEIEQRDIISKSMATITKATGKRPRGWRSPGFSSNFYTPDILAEEGVRYMSDWSNDDQPYPINVKKGSLIGLPSDQVDDLRFPNMCSEDYYQTIKDHFDTLYHDGAIQARTFGFCLHTFAIGRPHRISILDKILQYMQSQKGVWFATGWEIASWYYKNYLGIEEGD